MQAEITCNTQLSSWLIRRRGPPASFRLYCFSYAGGNASNFAAWQDRLSPRIEVCAVQLPGRGARFGEPLYDSLPELVSRIAQIIASDASLPFAFFGHSLGALIAFELTRYCRRHFLAGPQHLFVSGSAAPQCRDVSRRLHQLDDDALVEALKEYGGTPPEILENRELMTLVLPAIRADFALAENYKYHPSVPLDIPVTVFAGVRDSYVSVNQAESWKTETNDACRVHWFNGDHFFIDSERSAVLECLSAITANLPVMDLFPGRSAQTII